MNKLLIQVPALEKLAMDLLIAMGSPEEVANITATSLLKSDIRGIKTHGVALLPMYARMIDDGAIRPSATVSLTRKTDCIISVDGQDGFGQVAGQKATAAGIEIAKKSGLALVAVKNASHLGRLGEWAEQAADAGLVFSAFSNTGGGALNVAAHGSTKRKLSTNPIAFAVPSFDALPFNIIVDFATSQVSGALIQEHAFSNTPLQEDWVTTASGESLRDARAFMDGEGAMLPLGGQLTGHKGYALAIIAELFGGIAGGMVAGQRQPEWFSNAATFSFLDPLQLLTVDEMKEHISAIAGHLDVDNVRLPGQGAYRQSMLTEKQGVSVADHVLDSLLRLADKLGVAVTREIRSAVDTDNAGG